MRSTTGAHYIALDHVRALAAFLVFTWHFTHSVNGFPVPYEYVPALFPFAILDEGHTGVALFMTLSGYLFAKLLDGKSIRFSAFLWNRVLRLVPLLLLVIALVALIKLRAGSELLPYLKAVAKGPIFPTLPNGGWSITIEFHFYLILPIFLWMIRTSRFLPFSIMIVAIILRLLIYLQSGEIQSLAYWTIVGRIDQFALGMMMFQFRHHLAHRHLIALLVIVGFLLFYWYFDREGGFFHNPGYPSTSLLWVVFPTIEGLAYALAIAWYETSFTPSRSGISKFIGHIGEYSYSIYLFHFFIVFYAAGYIHGVVMDISNFYLASLWSLITFFVMIPIGYLSFRFIESPFLKLRKPYIIPAAKN